MTSIKKIEKRAAKNGLDITIGPATNWIGSKGKGKWAYSRYIKGRGIYEPESAYKSLKELEKSLED